MSNEVNKRAEEPRNLAIETGISECYYVDKKFMQAIPLYHKFDFLRGTETNVAVADNLSMINVDQCNPSVLLNSFKASKSNFEPCSKEEFELQYMKALSQLSKL